MSLIQWRDKGAEQQFAAGGERLAGILDEKFEDLAGISSSGRDETEAALCSRSSKFKHSDSQFIEVSFDLKARAQIRAERRGPKLMSRRI